MKIFNPFIGILFILMFSCSSETESLITPEIETTDASHITLAEAIELADNHFNHSRVKEEYAVDYITSSTLPVSRNGYAMDTLAYILNKKDCSGFILVAYPSIENPILAYSDEGEFIYSETEDNIVYHNFVRRLDSYLSEPYNYQFPDSLIIKFDPPVTEIFPKLRVPMHQNAPYNYYVDLVHPDCPVGCVAVATAQIMAHTKKYLNNYHSEKFQLYDMISAFPRRINDQITQYPINPTYSKEEAQDRFAKLLYYIGKDVNMSYSPGGSGAYSKDAYNLLKYLGYEIYENKLRSYSPMEVAWSIIDGYLVYMKGYDFHGGHAWVIDGAKWDYPAIMDDGNTSRTDFDSGPKPLIRDIYVHCDWGWGGNCNGYYNGTVFTAGSYVFSDLQFFSVKIEY